MKARLIISVVMFFCAAGLFAAEKKGIDKKVNKAAKPQAPVAVGVLLDGFEVADWTPVNYEGTTVKTAAVPGKEGKALEIDYDLKDTKQWVAINKDIPVADREGKALEFYVMKKSGDKENNLECKLIDEDGSFFLQKFSIPSAKGFQKIHLEMSDFIYGWGGDDKLGAVKKIDFAVSAKDGGSGSILLDDLRLVPSTASKEKKVEKAAEKPAEKQAEKPVEKIKSGIFDRCDSIEGWTNDGETGALSKLVSVTGVEKQAVAIDYDLSAANWVQFEKLFPLEVTSKSVIRFFLKWTGEQNNVEFKVVDMDDSNFGKKFESLAKQGEWQEIKVPVSELTYWWGGADKELDMKNIKGIWIAVGKNKGGKGVIAVDNFELIP